MRDRPRNREEVDKAKGVVHFVLTGWQGQYNIRHPQYVKIPYSSHSNSAELDQFVKVVKPRNLVMNLTHFQNDPQAINFMAQLNSYCSTALKQKFVKPTSNKQSVLSFGQPDQKEAEPKTASKKRSFIQIGQVAT